MRTRWLTLLGCMALMLAGAGGAAADEPAKSASNPPDSYGIFAGYRAVSLPVSGHQLTFLRKGQFVDVLVTFEAKMTDRKEKVTATILQNVLIVDLLKPAGPTEPGAIQLLLNPNEAQYAALAVIQGDIHITARAAGDTKMQPMEMASFRKLFK